MEKQLTTIEGFKLVDLCKAGGLQDVYQIAVDASSELLNAKDKNDRKRMRSLAANVSKSKTLFVNALDAHIKSEEAFILEGKKELKSFKLSMDELRDATKAPAIAMDKLLGDELEAYSIAKQMAEDEAKAAQKKIDDDKAMVFAHMEAKEQNVEFDGLMSKQLIAQMHCENKGKVFDLELWEAEQVIKGNEQQDPEIITSVADHILKQRFVMPVAPVSIIGLCAGTAFTELAAAEDLVDLFPVIGVALAYEIIAAIKSGSINSVEWVG